MDGNGIVLCEWSSSEPAQGSHRAVQGCKTPGDAIIARLLSWTFKKTNENIDELNSKNKCLINYI